MADFKDVMEYEKEATYYVALLDEEKPTNRNICVGIEAIVHAILAVGVRIDYALNNKK